MLFEIWIANIGLFSKPKSKNNLFFKK
jgi:hypothetical protein